MVNPVRIEITTNDLLVNLPWRSTLLLEKGMLLKILSVIFIIVVMKWPVISFNYDNKDRPLDISNKRLSDQKVCDRMS